MFQQVNMPSYLPDWNLTNYIYLRERREELAVFETFIYCTLIFMAIMGNSLVLWIVYKNRSLRTIPNYFVISLAFADIGMALLGTPWTIAVLATGTWPFDFAACQFQGFMVIWMAISSLQNLTIMAINRYYRIVKSNLYRRYFTPKTTRFYILGAYIYAATSPFPYVIGGNVFVFQPGKGFCYQKSMVQYTIPLMLLGIGLPTFIIIVCYVKVFLALRVHRKNLLTKVRLQSNRITVEDIRITKTLFATVVGFLLCWMPVLLIEMVDLGLGSATLPRQVYLMFTMCGLSSSVINPVIYGVMNKTFRREYKKTFVCLKTCQPVIAVQPTTQLNMEAPRTVNKVASETQTMY